MVTAAILSTGEWMYHILVTHNFVFLLFASRVNHITNMHLHIINLRYNLQTILHFKRCAFEP